MFAQWPVPIVFSRGAFVPAGVFALMFVAFSGSSKPAVLAGAALLGGFGGIVSLIVHELGHVSIARRLAGVRPEKVSVMCLGAAAHFEGSYRNGREQARMALGGPEASFAFAVALALPVFFPAPVWLKVGALAFDSTRISSTTVDFPLDVVLFERDGHEMHECRYEKSDLAESCQWWQERLRASAAQHP